MVKDICHGIRNFSYRKEFALSGSKFFPLREGPIMKRDAVEENHCLLQKSPFDVRNFFSVLATPLPLIHMLIGSQLILIYTVFKIRFICGQQDED